jgi:mannose-6-phosphate isomerase-like protein (cupin superfamily)
MAYKNQLLDMSPLGMMLTVIQTGADTNGKSLDLQMELFPGCNMKDPMLHIHPYAIETYEVLEGELEFFVKDKWVPAKKGDKLTVPIGVTHFFRNPTDKTAKVFNTHQPAFNMETYFEDVCKVLDKVTRQRTKPFKMNLRAKFYLGVLMNKYRKEIIARRPPDLAVRLLGFIGKIVGIKY